MLQQENHKIEICLATSDCLLVTGLLVIFFSKEILAEKNHRLDSFHVTLNENWGNKGQTISMTERLEGYHKSHKRDSKSPGNERETEKWEVVYRT